MMSPRSFLVSRQNELYSHSKSPAIHSLPRSTVPSPQSRFTEKKDEQFTTDEASGIGSTNTSDITFATMSAKSRMADAKRSPTPSPPKTTTTLTRPNIPTSPVQIPMKPKSREPLHPQNKHQHQHRHHGERRHHSAMHRPKDVHSPDAIPASVAALLAVTSIPPPKSSRSVRQSKLAREKRMTVESIIERSHESEKELSLTFGRGPLDLLLTAPEDLNDDDTSFCDSNIGSPFSTRTVSLESMPSLVESFATGTPSSGGTPHTPARRRKMQPMRRSLQPVSSPQGEADDHPLSSPENELTVEDLDFRVFDETKAESQGKKASRLPFKPLKSAFKSNLTASLRALRQAAKSFSTLNFPSIPPEDFLTRSILTLDPQVPYTDERRPPPLEEEPTAELRRYLNPTTTVRLEQPRVATATPGPTTRTFTASIQMQTYKVHRARIAPPATDRIPYPSAGPTSATSEAPPASPQQKTIPGECPMPGPRQREMRENSDFIRIAVMEMAMRRRGKLDDQRPGRARWALPPRKVSTRPYEIGADGVPARWVPVTC
ncbi:hypothetical protein QBC46DRAFT_126289 [Diplogelasinospora grovesii]|uniref:Uncharacterized protein n=1 Tax=Diplogelasinospora grovesii TaxID=303347 RepID=A0AAN6N8W3_9PEZI|nr:hypothetical protein QBC46DRAFT_126289 [Diplogelasinospora grovesii]